jgi:hypothetical protein
MVELLFEETASTYRKRILYPGCGEGELIAAVERYFQDSTRDPPTGVAIDTNEEYVETVREKYGDTVTVEKGDYLSADVRLDSFEFVLSYPPTVRWGDLSGEKQQEYATSFAQISPDAARIHTGLLFLERSLHVLTEDGSGVFLTTRGFKTEERKGPFRTYLAPKVADVEQIDREYFEADIPHMLLKVNSPKSEEFDPSISTVRPDPSEVETQLMASASSPTISDPARRIATCFPDLDVYGTDDDAAFVYLDLYYEDYDAAFVFDDPEQVEGFQGYVSRAEMNIRGEGPVTDHILPLEDSDCIDPEDDVGTVIERLGRDGERFCFVGMPDNPEGIVTRFDLNKIPVYQYLYVLLARFEIRLREIIREHVPNWENETDVYISSTDVGELAPDKLSGGSVGDLLDILSKADEIGQVHPDLQTYDADIRELKNLRDAVAHYNPLVHYMSNDADSDWTAGDLRDRHTLLLDIVES